MQYGWQTEPRPLGRHVLPLMDSGPSEDEQLTLSLQAGQGGLYRLHIGVTPVYIDDPRLTKQPANQGTRDSSILAMGRIW